MIDQEFVQYIVSSLVSKPDKVRVERVVDERGVLLTLHVDDEDLGRVIGRKGSTAQSLRVLLRALGSKNEAHYNLRIADDKDNGGRSPKPSTAATTEKAEEVEEAETAEEVETTEKVETTEVDQSNDMASDFASTSNDSEEKEKETDNDSLLDKTKRELDDLNDLDI